MTPNSFSDQGKSLNPDVLSEQLISFLKKPDVIPDFGFESTAPMNTAISIEDEWQRFDSFLKLTREIDFQDRPVSFDTYKIENFRQMKKAFLTEHGVRPVLFNDVSGCLDADLSRLLQTDPHFSYIYTFSHIPFRELTLKHMQFCLTGSIAERCLESFKKAHAFFEKHQRGQDLILDPGFGFSKTYEENWQLLDSFAEVLEGLEKAGIKAPVLIGLSKKSFLRKKLQTDSFSESEHLHFQCLTGLMKLRPKGFLFRVHDPRIVELARLSLM